jgi:carbamoyltransferase
MSNVIGISAHYHDAACCLLRDGKLVSAAQEERFSREKHDGGLPWRAFRYCLEESGWTLPDLDCVAYYEDPLKRLERQVWVASHPRSSPASCHQLLQNVDPDKVERDIREKLGFEGRVEYVEHHQAHAASSYFFSGFDDAAILTVDGVGEWATTTYGRGSGTDLQLFEEVQFPHSIGLLYSTITAYLGFEINEGESKVMGLAAYGKPRYLEKMRRLLRRRVGGQYELDLAYFDFLSGERMFSDALLQLLGRPPRERDSGIDRFHEDVARSLQAFVEELLLDAVNHLHGKTDAQNLCLAGGVALNCVANGRIRREGPFRNVFVQPAASDAGGALGAAAIAYLRLTGRGCEPLHDVYLGPGFSAQEIHAVLTSMGLDAHDYRGRTDALLDEVVARLERGEIVGWFRGRMEFGPRALGARSFLGDPRRHDLRDRINASVKRREAFRPFAPSVLEARAREHFALDHPSPFMLETCQVRSRLDLPAITHVDGTARPQTVNPETNLVFASLLGKFEARTGCPLLLNTSMNVSNEPIVCTPIDALVCFVRSEVDALVLEDFLLDREGVSKYRLAIEDSLREIDKSLRQREMLRVYAGG